MSTGHSRLKPSRKAPADLTEYIRRIRRWREKFKSEGRHFDDSTEIIREDRKSRDRKAESSE